VAGALQGIRIIEFAGIGPGPFCAMMLADHGAEVIRIERPGGFSPSTDPLLRSRRRLVVDMKKPGAVEMLRGLCRSADGLIEGYRPGVMERLGLGPDVLLADQPKLVYGRMTGWGQTGPLAPTAGHDIDYIAISGTLHTVGRAGETPVPAVNYLGDFAGGGMMLAFGMVAALLAVRMGGPGQVIDAAMTDGSALIAAMTWGLHAAGLWRDERQANLLDGAAHFYDTYRCADGRDLAVGAIEPQFYAEMRRLAGLADDADLDSQMAFYAWPDMKAKLAATFRTRTRDEWAAIFDGTDACVSPVLSMAEAPAYAHNAARGTFIETDGVTQPAPAPRYSATVADVPRMPAGVDTEAVLASIGYDAARVEALRGAKVLG
jgi:alpha-methylacyl-CoA racemase